MTAKRRMNILDSTGHTELKWDPENEEECAAAREQIQALKSKGFVFFLTDGRPADEVTAGQGTVLVRRLNAVEIDIAITEKDPAPDDDQKSARGRPPKTSAPSPEIVAVRQQRGG